LPLKSSDFEIEQYLGTLKHASGARSGKDSTGEVVEILIALHIALLYFLSPALASKFLYT